MLHKSTYIDGSGNFSILASIYEELCEMLRVEKGGSGFSQKISGRCGLGLWVARGCDGRGVRAQPRRGAWRAAGAPRCRS